MELKKITAKKDIEIVRSFFRDIFWEEPDYDLIHFKESITGKHNFQRLEYYLGYENNIIVGISGVYDDNSEECWLGWFGVRPKYRRKGCAFSILNLQLEIMKNYGYKICRLYTDEVINNTAVRLYIKNGFKKNSDYKNHIITMVKPLNNETKVTKWQRLPLGFVP